MANILKIKLMIGLVSVAVLTYFHVYYKAPYREDTFIRWRELSWDDFKGPQEPTNEFAAAIFSNVYLHDYVLIDSVEAFAAMFDQYSWVKPGVRDAYSLRHEQYHFNLTEYYARRLNRQIREEQLKTEKELNDALETTRNDLDQMQDRYDGENNHSLNVSMQRYWEFRIDSLFRSLEPEKGWVTDYYSGAHVFLPKTCELTEGLTANDVACRKLYVEEFGLRLALEVRQDYELDTANLQESYNVLYTHGLWSVTTVKQTTGDFGLEVWVEADNTEESFKMLDRWVYDGAYWHRLNTVFPASADIPNGYLKAAYSFINSFRIIETRDYWVDAYNVADDLMARREASLAMEEGNKEERFCINYSNAGIYGFYGRPVPADTGSIILPYRPLIHYREEVKENVAVIGNSYLMGLRDSLDVLYLITPQALDEAGSNKWIRFGYLLKKDSVRECYKFFHQKMAVDDISVASDTLVVQ
ncbi:hypothetical protein AB9P05_21815 [Roseivirga sp. BDSF3-8]|uniref:hypothetical protein n=1 Tax=Roseivirga sp. BDSF3-8 TaxID=3241598 RepID=UPI00353255FA